MRIAHSLLLLAYAGELISAEAMGTVQKYDEKAFDAVTTTGNYLPRLQLMTSNSKPCKSGVFPINNYAVVTGEKFDDVGKEVDVLVIAWRPKAIEMGEVIINAYDPNTDEFKRIQAQSEVKDSGCMYGPEYLLWVPSKKKFVTFMMGSKSARREAPALNALLRKAATLKSKHIETAKYDWYAPLVAECNTPFDMPDMADLKVELDKFNNPPATDVEKAPEAPAEGQRAR